MFAVYKEFDLDELRLSAELPRHSSDRRR